MSKPSSYPHEEPEAGVVVIDDDGEVRTALESLFRSVGLHVDAFGAVREFLESKPSDRPRCLIIDARLPGQSGLEFIEELLKARLKLPAVFVTGYADVAMSIRAMKAGAIEFLTKPISHQDLLDAVHRGIAIDRAHREEERTLAALRGCFASLTAREREIMAFVVDGQMNKQIAAKIGISEATVKLHRGHIMHKMHAKSLAHLVRMSDRLILCESSLKRF